MKINPNDYYFVSVQSQKVSPPFPICIDFDGSRNYNSYSCFGSNPKTINFVIFYCIDFEGSQKTIMNLVLALVHILVLVSGRVWLQGSERK